ncbi:MAG: general secretion pathway protein GspB [Deltaproteobacteria bacterium]|nr:general secretion pathway protein GspB [Deltaproteobacteria bacterium]
MTKREKFIVGLAALAVGYGAVELLLPRASVAPVPQPQSIEGLNAFITKVADATRVGTAEASAIVIQKAEAAWGQDPFLDIQKPKAAEATAIRPKETTRLPNLTYSGFIELGSKRLAIINGQEYEAGDKLNPGGFTIKSILPTRVMIVSAQGEGAPIVLPLQESE